MKQKPKHGINPCGDLVLERRYVVEAIQVQGSTAAVVSDLECRVGIFLLVLLVFVLVGADGGFWIF